MSKKAFTLIELSIVIAIAGLFISAILFGKTAIENAKIQKLSSDLNQIIISVNSFYGIYEEVPGDMDTAYSYWGSACGSSTVCNGDSDQLIEDGDEREVAVKHIALAGLLPPTLACFAGPCNLVSASGANANLALSEISSMPIMANFYNTVSSPQWSMTAPNFLVTGGSSAGSPALAYLLPEQIKKIDNKLDDGEPDTGYVVPANTQGTCCVGDSCTNSSYDTSEATELCSVNYGFELF